VSSLKDNEVKREIEAARVDLTPKSMKAVFLVVNE
jgi:hypothetical protein